MWIKKSEYAELVRNSREADRLWHERISREERASGYMRQIIDLRKQNDSLYEKIRELQRENADLKRHILIKPWFKNTVVLEPTEHKWTFELSLKSAEATE